jgi:hypothetical protein
MPVIISDIRQVPLVTLARLAEWYSQHVGRKVVTLRDLVTTLNDWDAHMRTLIKLNKACAPFIPTITRQLSETLGAPVSQSHVATTLTYFFRERNLLHATSQSILLDDTPSAILDEDVVSELAHLMCI